MEVASLGLGLQTDQADKATASLNAFAKSAEGAERSAKKVVAANDAAGASSEEFSRRVKRNIETLQFQAQQFQRNGAEQERYTALRRAGVTADSAAGAAVSRHVQALQEQRAAQQQATEAARQATEEARRAQQAAAEAARIEQQRSDAVRKVVADLEFERAQLGRTATERAQYDALKRAGVTAASAEGKAIMATVANLELEREALRKAEMARLAAGKATVGMTAAQRTQLGFQLNDIFTSAVGGMNPAMIAAQQGPQITQIFGGLRATLAAIPKPLLVASGAALGAVAIAAVANSIKGLSDAADEQRRRLAGLLGSQHLAATAYGEITKEAVSTGKAISDVSADFTRFVSAGQGLGATVQQIMALSTATTQLGRLGGLTPEETTTGAGTIAKVLSENIVSAESLKAVFDAMPTAARAIADGLGVSAAQLKLMAQQGDLTNRQVFASILGQTDQLKKDFDQLPKTLGSVFSGLIIEAEQFAASLYKSVTNLTLIDSKAENIRRRQEANPNRPTRATPRVIGNPGFDFSDAAAETDLAAGMMASRGIGEAVTVAADAAAIAASKLATDLNPAVAEAKVLQQQIIDTARALDLLRGGFTSFSTDKAEAEVNSLTDSLRRLQEKALASPAAYGPSAKDAPGLTPGMREYNEKISQAVISGRAPNAEAAQFMVDGDQLRMLDQMIEKQRAQTAGQAAMTLAMKGGKAAADDMAVGIKLLALTTEQLGKLSPDAIEKVKLLGALMRGEAAQVRAQASLDASKPLLTELAGIAAAADKVTYGLYAMAKARAEAVASRDENGTGQLQMQVFEANQILTDAQSVVSLKLQVDLTNKLAAAAGDVARQKKIQLDHDIMLAKSAAHPDSGQFLEEQMRAKAAADDALAYGNIIAQSKEFVAQQEVEQAAAFATAEGAARLRFEYQLLNQAKQAGIDLSLAQVQALKDEAAAMAQAQAKAQRLNEIVTFGKTTTTAFLTDFRNGLQQGQSVWDAFGNAGLNALNKINDKLIEMAVSDVFDQAFGGAKGAAGSAGGGLFGLISGWLGIGGGSAVSNTVAGTSMPFADALAGGVIPLAKGGVLDRGNVIPFARGAAFDHGRVTAFAGGGIVDRPTNFPMAGGRTGLMGEAGTEGIFPLHRGRDGKLGVRASGLGGQSGQQQPVIKLEVTGDTGLVRVIARDESGKVLAQHAPGIENRAVKRSTELAPAAVKQDKAMKAPDWRMGRG